MGSEVVVLSASSKRPQASVQAERSKKFVLKIDRLEGILDSEYKVFLKENGNLAPDLYQLKQKINKKVDYNNNTVSEFLSFIFFEAVKGRHPNYKIQDKVYLVPR